MSAGGAGAVSSLSLYSLSSLHGFLFFHTTALRNNKLREGRTGLGAVLWDKPLETPAGGLGRLWKGQSVFVLPAVVPAQMWLWPGLLWGLRSHKCPAQGVQQQNCHSPSSWSDFPLAWTNPGFVQLLEPCDNHSEAPSARIMLNHQQNSCRIWGLCFESSLGLLECVK